MAGASETTNAEKAEKTEHNTPAEIEELKTKYGSDCRVITDVGVFTFVVTVQVHGKDLSIKFQIDDTYPQNLHSIVIRSGQMSDADKENLLKYISEEAGELVGSPMLVAVLNLAKVWVEDHQLDLSIKDQRDTGRQKQKSKHKRKGKTPSKKSDEEENDSDAKKPPMKTAEDVISRVLWDDSLSSDCFTVGYMDRFLGVVEENFTTLSWENISSVDYNTLAVPKHRIQYFKYKDVKVWDKKLRLDNVFGSVGSGVTITDIISQWEQDHPHANPEPNTWGYSSDDEDEDDDGIVIHTGHEETVPEDELSSKEKYWGAKIRPTHFLALRITDPTIVSAAREAHQALVETEPMYEDCIIPAERLHITLACLGLDTQHQIDEAVKALNDIKSELDSEKPREIEVQMEGVGNFFDTTLYAKVEENPRLCQFVEHLKTCMTQAGVHLRDIFDFQPHMTLMKLSRQLARDSHNPYLDPRVYTQLEGKVFGRQVVDNIHLCAMSEDREYDGFYECPTSVLFD